MHEAKGSSLVEEHLLCYTTSEASSALKLFLIDGQSAVKSISKKEQIIVVRWAPSHSWVWFSLNYFLRPPYLWYQTKRELFVWCGILWPAVLSRPPAEFTLDYLYEPVFT